MARSWEELRETVDGELQTYGAKDGAYNRQRFFSKTKELSELVAHLSDEQIDGLTRGGHDPVKIYGAFDAARSHVLVGPTVVLAHTCRRAMDWDDGAKAACPPILKKNSIMRDYSGSVTISSCP